MQTVQVGIPLCAFASLRLCMNSFPENKILDSHFTARTFFTATTGVRVPRKGVGLYCKEAFKLTPKAWVLALVKETFMIIVP